MFVIWWGQNTMYIHLYHVLLYVFEALNHEREMRKTEKEEREREREEVLLRLRGSLCVSDFDACKMNKKMTMMMMMMMKIFF